jgi:hypothetical protein
MSRRGAAAGGVARRRRRFGRFCCAQGRISSRTARAVAPREKADIMITVLAQFKLPQPITREQAREIFLGTAPKYQGMRGLVRKYYVLSQDGGTAGGVYLWESRADAERLYTDEWKSFVRGKYGVEPSLTYFESPVIVDNVSNQIASD